MQKCSVKLAVTFIVLKVALNKVAKTNVEIVSGVSGKGLRVQAGKRVSYK
jgi:hypothetical protein